MYNRRALVLFIANMLASIPGCGVDNNGPNKRRANSIDGVFLSVNFDNINRGGTSAVRYTAQQLESDFQWNMLGHSGRDGGNNYYGPLEAPGTYQADSTWITPDPSGNTGRGNVLRVTHHKQGIDGPRKGGMNVRADFSPVDEVYFAYDVYLSPDYEYMLQEKMPGVFSGTMLEASHPSYTAGPSADDPWRGVSTFTTLMQMETGTRGSDVEGALGLYHYDALGVQKMKWLNTLDPTSGAKTGQYLVPRGQWVTIEQHIKMNTADNDRAYDPAKDLNDGLAEVWINGVLVSKRKHVWRKWQNLKCDGFELTSFYGGNPDSPLNIPSKTQYKYFDNFIVSTSPITH